MAVMIGIDPHKGSHTAMAIDDAETELGELRARAGTGQVERLLAWAATYRERTWAVEGAGGLGDLLAQQLVAAGEGVLDVQPKLAARVRLLATAKTDKNHPNDARSVAVAARRSPNISDVGAEDHAAVMKLWAKRHRDLGRARTQVACRLQAVLCELVPGGFSGEIYAARAAQLLDRLEPQGAVATARHELAWEFVADLIRLDEQRRDTKQRIAAAVAASKTTTAEIFGVGPIVAAIVIGYVGDGPDSKPETGLAPTTAPPPRGVSGARKIHRLSRRGNRRLNHAIHMAAVTQIRHRHSDGRAYYDRKLAEAKTGKEALRALERRISDALYARLQQDARRAAQAPVRGPGGQPGNDSDASATGSHPEHRLFGQATPGPEPTLRHTVARPRTMTSPRTAKKIRKAS